MGRIVVDARVCKGCGYCINFCPKKVIHFGETRNSSGYGNRVAEQIGGADCVACKTCAIVCPDSAITVYK